MYRSESIINNLLIEVNSIGNRTTCIKQAYRNTSHFGLRERLFNENKIISQRLEEIHSIAKILKSRTVEKISFSSLLLEQCERIIFQTRKETNLFFL